MKTKILLFIGMLIFAITAYSQTDAVIVKQNGYFGVGCDPDVAFKFYHNTGIPIMQMGGPAGRLGVGIANQEGQISPQSRRGDVVFFSYAERHEGNLPHGLIFLMNDDNNDGRSYVKFGDSHNSLWFGIFNDRKVRIDGEVFAKKIMVKTDVWADDVFDKGYQLMTLPEIESFIKSHNHLPGIPCAEEAIEEGINVSEMNAVLLRKIEELTLHMIEQNKRIEVQEELIQQLQKKVKEIH